MSLKTRGILVIVIGTILGVSLSVGGNLLADKSRPAARELTWDQARMLVEVMERVNARHLEADAVPEACGLITVDVSFISLAKIVPALLPHLASGGRIVTLIKPQFEAGKGQVDRSGVVRDPDVRHDAIRSAVDALGAAGLGCVSIMPSPITGSAGNIEYVAWFRTGAPAGDPVEDLIATESTT